MYKITYHDIESAIHDLNEYVKANMRTRENPQLSLGEFHEGKHGLAEYAVPFVSVRGEFEFEPRHVMAVANLVPGARMITGHNSDKTAISYYIKFPCEFPVDSVPPRYKTARKKMAGPPSFLLTSSMLFTGLAGLFWAYQMKL